MCQPPPLLRRTPIRSLPSPTPCTSNPPLTNTLHAHTHLQRGNELVPLLQHRGRCLLDQRQLRHQAVSQAVPLLVGRICKKGGGGGMGVGRCGEGTSKRLRFAAR